MSLHIGSLELVVYLGIGYLAMGFTSAVMPRRGSGPRPPIQDPEDEHLDGPPVTAPGKGGKR